MRYLVCDKCEGYYKLRQGESPRDFLDKCACGGNLKYQMSRLSDKKETPSQNRVRNPDPRILRLILGIIIVLAPNLLFYNPAYYFFFTFYGIPLIIAGFISSIFTEGNFKDGILNGIRVGLFSGVIYLLIALVISFVYGNNILSATGSMTSDLIVFTLSFLVLILFTSFGGVMGTVTRILLISRESHEKPKGETPETIKKTPDPAESQYHDEMVELGYKQISAINDGEEVFKALLSDSIQENSAIERLKNDQKIVNDVLKAMENIKPPLKYREYHSLKIEAAQDISQTFEIMDGLIEYDENKILKTEDLVVRSTTKINQAITELQKTMQDEDDVK